MESDQFTIRIPTPDVDERPT
ncbi:MAG: hypothetical protein ACD_48C00651G0001, partial [uncultured bacterium]